MDVALIKRKNLLDFLKIKDYIIFFTARHFWNLPLFNFIFQLGKENSIKEIILMSKFSFNIRSQINNKIHEILGKMKKEYFENSIIKCLEYILLYIKIYSRLEKDEVF
jgi:hypothetical protein